MSNQSLKFNWRFFVVSALVFLGSTSETWAGAIKKQAQAFYNPEIAALEGTLTHETFPGPPEFESVKRGDRPESFWILNLKHPITVLPKNGDEAQGVYPQEPDIRKLQLIIDEEKISPEKLGFKAGLRCRVTGVLYHQATIHHRTKVLMAMEKADRLGTR